MENEYAQKLNEISACVNAALASTWPPGDDGSMFSAFSNASFTRLAYLKSCLFPYVKEFAVKPEKEDLRTDAERLRDRWISLYGDPSDPKVKLEIERLGEHLKAEYSISKKKLEQQRVVEEKLKTSRIAGRRNRTRK